MYQRVILPYYNRIAFDELLLPYYNRRAYDCVSELLLNYYNHRVYERDRNRDIETQREKGRKRWWWGERGGRGGGGEGGGGWKTDRQRHTERESASFPACFTRRKILLQAHQQIGHIR